ncbi:MAG: rRNA maturation RNase YbeY [Bacilli bacterium]|nr:rRNA maturation RNase YbeY [Bacilli bacterium]
MNEFDIIDNYNYKKIDYLEDLIKFTLKKFNVSNTYFSLILTNDEEVRNLNKKYRHINKTTDVLSFALNDGMSLNKPINMLGDIYISIPTMQKQAVDYNTGEKRELAFLVIHGLLHLLGYDHNTKEEEEVMFLLQKEILNEKKI